jgi:hypothetical protein
MDSLFTGWFVRCADMAPAERLFRSLWRGHLDEFTDVIAEAQRSGALVEPDGWLVRAFERVRKESVSVTLLGYRVADERVRTTRLEIRSDAGGNVMAVNGTAAVERETANYWLTRQNALGITLRLPQGQRPGARAELELTGAFTAAGRSMKRDELDMLYRSLAVMTGDARPLDLRRLLGAPATRFLDDAKFWNAATFMLPIRIDDGEWRTFAQRPEAEVRRTAVAEGMKCLDVAYAGFNAFARASSEILLGFGQEVNRHDPVAGVVAYLGAFPRVASAAMIAPERLRELGFAQMAESMTFSPLKLQVNVFLRFAQVVQALASLAGSTAALHAVLDGAGGMSEQQLFDRVAPRLKEMAQALEPVAVASQTFTGLGESVPWPMVAFAVSMAVLCGRKVPPGFVPSVAFKGMEDRPVPLLAF